jgi:hypothetical protein
MLIRVVRPLSSEHSRLASPLHTGIQAYRRIFIGVCAYTTERRIIIGVYQCH